MNIFSNYLKHRHFAWLILVVSWLLALTSSPLLERMGWAFHDTLQNQYPETRVSDIVFIRLDQSTLNQMANTQGIYFPFDREVWAELLKVGKTHGAKAVGFDIIFSEESIRGPDDDDAFAQAIEESPFPIVFAGGARVPPPLPKFLKNNSKVGNTQFNPMTDGIYRAQLGPDEFGNSSLSQLLAELTGHSLSKDANEKLIHFTPHIVEASLYNVLIERASETPSPEMLALLKDKIWIVGYAAPGLHDLKSSPLSRNSSGTWIVANSLNNFLLEDSSIQQIPTSKLSLFYILFFGLALISLIKSPFLSPVSLGAQALFLMLILPALSTLVAWHFKVWLNPLPLFAGLFVLSVLLMLQRIFVEWRERMQFTKVVEHSMSAEMLRLIKEGKLKVDRFGERKQITILFADLAGFTTLSEKLKPEDLVDVINAYLDDVVDLVFKNKGYIDKFIGDAVMALWGAPVDDPQHTQNALATAIEFEEMTSKFQNKIKSKFNFDFEVKLITRVGLHSGEAIVGNLGARKRFNYTALGDAVNLAARLEGMGKHYNQLLTISGELVDTLPASLRTELVLVDEVVVKGKTLPTHIYTHCKDPSCRSRYNKAFRFYQKSLFEEALQMLSKDSTFGPENILRERCESLMTKPKNKHFREGIWYHDEK